MKTTNLNQKASRRQETVAAGFRKEIDMGSIPQSYTLKVFDDKFIVSFSTALLQLPEKPGDAGVRLAAICVLHDVQPNTIFSGAAICHPLDSFDQETGNKIALKRAAAAWLDYHDNNLDEKKYCFKSFRHALWEARLEAIVVEINKHQAYSTTTV